MWKRYALYSLAQFWILTTKLVNAGIFSTHDLFLFLLTSFDQKLVRWFWCLSNSPCSELPSEYVTVTSDVHWGVFWSSRNKTTSTKYTDSDTKHWKSWIPWTCCMKSNTLQVKQNLNWLKKKKIAAKIALVLVYYYSTRAVITVVQNEQSPWITTLCNTQPCNTISLSALQKKPPHFLCD